MIVSERVVLISRLGFVELIESLFIRTEREEGYEHSHKTVTGISE